MGNLAVIYLITTTHGSESTHHFYLMLKQFSETDGV